ncbi:hypothetical protein HPB47_021509 [Ixodes persulcatus]|uniref:Uncharacterized protein n=1 Tax=Ixodes persulcatus TaxID=34615 RepID=A0AC60QCD3_IXOPE|nr:hypothetical protein HPB47_021509 [Ixodes persulcatus]
MKHERGGNECKGFLTERDIDQIAERLEVTPEAEYERIMERVRQELKKKRRRVGKRQKYNLKRWWDRDVRVAISARKDACRKHQTAVSARWPEQARRSLWGIYRDKKEATGFYPGEASQCGSRVPGGFEKWSGCTKKIPETYAEVCNMHATPKQLLRHPESEVLSETEGLQFVATKVAAEFVREEGKVDEVECDPGTECDPETLH